ncbi:MAG TPA: zinc metallopeptidase, partial [Candidatus Cloacimonadota bacterium]|nr:zinc metallopeptidase [Candidatus Cloacimonadota bacterium]
MFLPFDGTMILIIPVLILAFWAQSKVRSNFTKYSKIRSSTGQTGAEAAEAILRENGFCCLSSCLSGGTS